MDVASAWSGTCCHHRRTAGGSLWLPLLLILGLAGPAPAGAQSETWVPELSGTRDTGTSARAMGLGGAYLALSDDAAALVYNPAGLARVSRIEFSGGLIDRRVESTNTDHGVSARATMTRTRVNSLGFVYPFPTYRGSMVIGLGYNVPYVADREYLRTGPREGGDLYESIFDEGTIGEWSFGYAVDVSPTLSFGLRTSFVAGSLYQFWTYRDPLSLEDPYWVEDSELNTKVRGLTASFGALARLGERGRLGLVIDLPRWLTLKPETIDADGNVASVPDEKVTLPFSVGAGAAGFAGPLLLTADVRLTDWTQIDYKGPLRYVGETGLREFAYRRTLDLHAGAEYLVDLGVQTGLRLRAGIERVPVRYGVVFTDVVYADTGQGTYANDPDPVYHEATFDPDRVSLSLGVGLLVRESFTADLAYVSGSFTRSGGQLSEKVDERRLLLTGAFRLE